MRAAKVEHLADVPRWFAAGETKKSRWAACVILKKMAVMQAKGDKDPSPYLESRWSKV